MKRLRSPSVAYPILAIAVLVSGVSLSYWLRTNEIRLHFEAAERFVQSERGPEAEAEWQSVLKRDPKNAAAQELLAEYYLSRQSWKKGEAAFRRLYELDAKLPHVLCKVAACQLRMDQQKEAIETGRRELQLDGNCVTALGLVYSLLSKRGGGEEKERYQHIRKLAALQPDDQEVQRMYVEVLTNQYLYDEMRPVIERLLRFDPNDVQAHNLRGLVGLASKNQPQGTKDAIADFEKSLQITAKSGQGNGGAHFGLGRAYIALDQLDKGVVELEEAHRLLPKVARIVQMLNATYQRLGQPAKAAEMRRRFTALQKLAGDERILTVRSAAYPNNPEYPLRLAEIYMQTDRPDRALFYLNVAAKLRPNDAQIKLLVAQAQKAAYEQSIAAQ